MKNKEFTRKTATEKRRHLSAVLRHAAGSMLDDAMIGYILTKATIHKQYTISAYSNKPAFQEAVARAQAGKTPLPTVYSRTRRGPVTAVITPNGTGYSKKSKRVIIICVPNLNNRKGIKQWAKASRNG